jgi:hypothetical protein
MSNSVVRKLSWHQRRRRGPDLSAMRLLLAIHFTLGQASCLVKLAPHHADALSLHRARAPFRVGVSVRFGRQLLIRVSACIATPQYHQVGQCFLELRDAGVGDARSLELEDAQVRHPFEVFQSRVGNLCAFEGEIR